jgi:hypothetical protein
LQIFVKHEGTASLDLCFQNRIPEFYELALGTFSLILLEKCFELLAVDFTEARSLLGHARVGLAPIVYKAMAELTTAWSEMSIVPPN